MRWFCPSVLLLLVAWAGSLSAAEPVDPDLAAARTAVAQTQDQIAGERRAMATRLSDLAREEADRDREIERLTAELQQDAGPDPAPARRDLARYVAALAGLPQDTALADSLARWRDDALARLRTATTVTTVAAPVTWWDGRQAQATVTRLGAAGAAVATPVPALVVPLGQGWRQAGPAIPGDARPGWIPVDVTGKLSGQTTVAAPTLWQRVRAGGWFVVPILATGVVALLLVVERLLSFRREMGDAVLGQEVVAAVERGDLTTARGHVVAARTPTTRILSAGLEVYERGFEARAAALGEAILAETPRIERSLTILGMLAAIAPLLGLLGTVSGMITMFQVLSEHGTGNPRLLSGGISEALITTQLGLLVAVPVLFAHALLTRRAERTLTRIEEQATAVASSHATDARAAAAITGAASG